MTNPDPQAQPLPNRNPALEGVRGIAILGVMFVHVMGICGDAGQVPAGRLEKGLGILFGEGWAGVDLFFVLSGFLITSILLRQREEKNYFSNFYMRRVLRIFPLYYLFLTVYFLILPSLFPGAPRFQNLGGRQWWYWSYISNLEVFIKGKWIPPAHCWSLAIEEQFYLLWPVLVYFIRGRKMAILTFSILIAQPLLRWFLISRGVTPEIAPSLTLAHLDGLMLGALLSLLYRRYAAELSRLQACGWALMAAGLMGRAVMPFLPPDYNFKHTVLGIFLWSLTGAGLISLSLGSSSRAWVNRFLSASPLTFLGKYSYGIYMIHHQVFELVSYKFGLVHGSALGSWTRVFLAGNLITFPAAWLLFRFFETPFLKLKDARFGYGAKARPLVVG